MIPTDAVPSAVAGLAVARRPAHHPRPSVFPIDRRRSRRSDEAADGRFRAWPLHAGGRRRRAAHQIVAFGTGSSGSAARVARSAAKGPRRSGKRGPVRRAGLPRRPDRCAGACCGPLGQAPVPGRRPVECVGEREVQDGVRPLRRATGDGDYSEGGEQGWLVLVGEWVEDLVGLLGRHGRWRNRHAGCPERAACRLLVVAPV